MAPPSKAANSGAWRLVRTRTSCATAVGVQSSRNIKKPATEEGDSGDTLSAHVPKAGLENTCVQTCQQTRNRGKPAVGGAILERYASPPLPTITKGRRNRKTTTSTRIGLNQVMANKKTVWASTCRCVLWCVLNDLGRGRQPNGMSRPLTRAELKLWSIPRQHQSTAVITGSSDESSLFYCAELGALSSSSVGR